MQRGRPPRERPPPLEQRPPEFPGPRDSAGRELGASAPARLHSLLPVSARAPHWISPARSPRAWEPLMVRSPGCSAGVSGAEWVQGQWKTSAQGNALASMERQFTKGLLNIEGVTCERELRIA